MWRVAVLDDYQGVAQEMADWGRLGPDVEVRVFRDHLDDADALVARLDPFQAVVAMRERTPFPAPLLARLPALRVLVTTGMANASMDLPAATRLGILVSGTRSLGHPTAELTWGLILALARSIPQEDRAVRRGEWQTTLGESLDGKTLGVIGLGNLGSRVAAIGRAFGMAVIAWSENLSAERAAECGAERVAKDALLTGADVVTVHLRLSARTRGLIGARDLRLMKPTSYLVNTSRGPIVDEGALLDAVTRGAIAGAALDVFDDEPLPAGHPFRRQPNVIVTPHLGYVTRDTYRVFYGDAVEDLRAFLDGHPVRVLNPDVQISRR
jgi:phosphoglycerate dehydrogenase-like enzyme